jgi:hypothetical protein
MLKKIFATLAIVFAGFYALEIFYIVISGVFKLALLIKVVLLIVFLSYAYRIFLKK